MSIDRETVYQLALEHGVIDPDLGGTDNWMTDYGSCEDQLMAFARAAVLAERERCARICESVNNYDNPMTASDCAAAIRKGE